MSRSTRHLDSRMNPHITCVSVSPDANAPPHARTRSHLRFSSAKNQPKSHSHNLHPKPSLRFPESDSFFMRSSEGVCGWMRGKGGWSRGEGEAESRSPAKGDHFLRRKLGKFSCFSTPFVRLFHDSRLEDQESGKRGTRVCHIHSR